jgi:mRNA interferase YafQ
MTTIDLERANNFKRKFKKLKLSNKEESAYIDVVYKLLNNIVLDEKYCDHFLKGDKNGLRECHIKPDLLLIYRLENNTLSLVDIGSHSELFK